MAYLTQRRGDEFYTRYEDVRTLLEQYLHILRAYRVICPFDTSESAFVRYLQENGISPEYSNELDFRQFDYRDAIAVTNPAFSCEQQYLNLLIDSGVRGSLTILPQVALLERNALKLIRERGYRAYDEGCPTMFERPSGNVRHINTCFLTNFGYNIYEGTRRRMPARGELVMTDEGLPKAMHAADVPVRFSGTIVAPCGWVASRYNSDFYELDAHSYLLHAQGRNLFRGVGVRCLD